MMEARRLIYFVLVDLDRHEQLVKDIRHVVDLNLSESMDITTIEHIRSLAFKLPSITLSVKEHILKLRDEFKLFQRIAAMSSKTKAVISNAFIYKKKDALKYTLQEYEAVRNLAAVFEIKELPYIGVST